MSFHVSVRTFLSLLCSLMDVSKPDCFIDMILCPQLLSPPPCFCTNRRGVKTLM
jgi:hypothetical protein